MKIGIIETGKPSATLAKEFGTYPQMFRTLIEDFLPDAQFFTKSVVSGEEIGVPEQADGWLVTGSRHSAYDDKDWIRDLKKFVELCFSEKIPLVGVCFGHQIIAEALGGKVHKTDKGWGIGAQKYSVSNKPDWMAELGSHYCSHAIHQDQIHVIPAGATVISGSDFCNYAALLYGDTDYPTALTIQSHPEIVAGFVKQIGKERLAEIVPADVLATGLAQLGADVNNKAWGKTFAQYFQRMAKARVEKRL